MSVSASFTAVGVGSIVKVPVGQQFSYDVSGTFVASWRLVQVTRDGKGPSKTLVSGSSTGSGTLVAEDQGKSHATYRMECTAFTSGTVVSVLAEITTEVGDIVRAPGGSAVLQATENGPVVPSDKVLTTTSQNLSTPLGAVCAIERTFTETAGAGVYTGSVTVPAGATLLDIIVNGVALWNNAGAVVMDVGDGDDPNGYFASIDLKATDLLAGESVSCAQAGGKAGAYIANSQVSPRYAAAARVISGIITTASTGGSTGRTRMTVVYHLPVSADISAATKV